MDQGEMDQSEISSLFEEGGGVSEAPSATKEEAEPGSLEERVNKKLESVTAKAAPAGGETKVVETDSNIAESSRGEVSAGTLARMMGLATVSEITLIEGKIDLMSTRVNGLTVRMEKVLNALNRMPNATDLDRIDINIGSLKTMIRETMDALAVKKEEEEGGDLSNATIMTSENSAADEEGAESASEESPE